MWLVLAVVLTVVFAPVQETVRRWRQELGLGRGGFAEAVVTPALVETTPGELSTPVAAPAIEIEVSGGPRARISASTPPALVAAVIGALRR